MASTKIKDVRRELFAQGMARGLSPADAYSEAGFKSSNRNVQRVQACKLGGEPDVKRRIAELIERGAVRAEVDKAWVLERLKRNAEIALGDVQTWISVAKKDDLNAEAEVYMRDAAAANKALELLGRELGMFKENVSHSGSIEIGLGDRLDRVIAKMESKT